MFADSAALFPSAKWFEVNGPPWWGWLLILAGSFLFMWALWATAKLIGRTPPKAGA